MSELTRFWSVEHVEVQGTRKLGLPKRSYRFNLQSGSCFFPPPLVPSIQAITFLAQSPHSNRPLSPAQKPLSFSLPSLPKVPETDPSVCVLDSFCIAIAQLLSDALGLDLEKAYNGVDYGKKGEDFTVALPRFRLPGKVNEVAQKVIDKVRGEYSEPEGIYGTGAGKKVIVEYSSPNIAKSFHVGHLRSTIIGAFLANLYKASDWEVISMNYLGDWGTQFGLIASGYEKYGNQEKLEADAIKHLFEIYVQVNKDAETDPTYVQEYERLNVQFDVYTGESEVSKTSMDEALERLEKIDLVEESNGAKLLNLEQWKLGKAVVRKKDGTSIYLTRDIGGAVERYEKYKFDKMIYVFFKVLELMGYEWAQPKNASLVHVNYGLVGTVVFLNKIIEEAANVMHEQMKTNEEKYNAGDAGPYLQYAHVRVASLDRKNPHHLPLPAPSSLALDLLAAPHTSQQARDIAFLLGTYPDVVKTALKTHEPSGVVTFAFRLAHAISSAWDAVVVKSLGEDEREKAQARLFLYGCARDVLGSALRLLTIRPLERM
ncbi:arginyl-tRNA synthetase [Ephemerocybe angulata]|uniref:arginine--tRNA ligase n=1 Tax=Ephemerocybe angulata TaxID=980116 RepID=A0A8H6MFR4_9AGAR|nr:arginyl-tRNA synthetase [Tulosesus angulatus]